MIKKINGLTINKKINLIIFLSIILLVFIGVPTLCNIIMNNKDNVYSVWDGTTSETFNSGSGRGRHGREGSKSERALKMLH